METRWDWLSYENADSFEWDSGRTPFTSIAVPMGGAALYLALISALMIWRHNKSKIDTTRVTQLHNLILVVISVILSYGVWSEVVHFYMKWLQLNRSAIAAQPTEVSTLLSWHGEYRAPWYSLCCHRWCELQPDLNELPEAVGLQQKGVLHDSFVQGLCPHDANPTSGPLYWWLYITYLFKFYDMFDTVLLVLKGSLRADNVSDYFLHIFHHATVPFCAWMGFHGRLLMPLWMGMGINNVVHGTMYSYYLLRTLGVKPPGWARKALTSMQTSQFALGAVMTAYGCYHFFKKPSFTTEFPFVTFVYGCDSDPTAIAVCACFNLAFLFLFLHWYRREYIQGKAKAKKNIALETCTPDLSAPALPASKDVKQE